MTMHQELFDDLDPRGVWKWFGELCTIPRPSGMELAVSDFLERFASERGLDCSRDATGNVLIRKGGSGAAQAAPPLMLQAHTDIVAEKLDSSPHDFLRDPIRVELEDGWVVARETTLGADNGIGVALMLAVLDDPSLAHPPLECLFTVDEERGLTGAAMLDPSWIAARRMINLDSEDEGRFCIGCAGGLDIHITVPVVWQGGASSDSHFRLVIEGLRGGHSGMEIGRSRANAVRIAARALDVLCSGRLCRTGPITAGSKRNAIPRSASAGILIPVGGLQDAVSALSALERKAREEYSGIDDGITMRLEPEAGDPRGVISAESTARLVDLLLALPHGVEKMSGIRPGLVETSCNLATVETRSSTVDVCLTVRSLMDDAKAALARRISSIAALAGLEAVESGAYPGWKPDPTSPILARAVEVYQGIHGRRPEIEAVHAGLECGIIGDGVGGMDMVSMGPDIRGVHAPGERVDVGSTARFWRFLTTLLAEL